MTRSTFAILEKDGGRISNFEIEVSILTKKFIRMPLFLQIYICTTRISLGQKFLNWSAFYLQFMISHNNNSTPLRQFFANDNAFSLRQCIVEFSRNCNLQTNFYETEVHICNLFWRWMSTFLRLYCRLTFEKYVYYLLLIVWLTKGQDWKKVVVWCKRVKNAASAHSCT